MSEYDNNKLEYNNTKLNELITNCDSTLYGLEFLTNLKDLSKRERIKIERLKRWLYIIKVCSKDIVSRDEFIPDKMKFILKCYASEKLINELSYDNQDVFFNSLFEKFETVRLNSLKDILIDECVIDNSCTLVHVVKLYR